MCILLSAAATVLLTAVSVVFARPVLELLQTPPEILDAAHSYIMGSDLNGNVNSDTFSGGLYATWTERFALGKAYVTPYTGTVSYTHLDVYKRQVPDHIKLQFHAPQGRQLVIPSAPPLGNGLSLHIHQFLRTKRCV